NRIHQEGVCPRRDARQRGRASTRTQAPAFLCASRHLPDGTRLARAVGVGRPNGAPRRWKSMRFTRSTKMSRLTTFVLLGAAALAGCEDKAKPDEAPAAVKRLAETPSPAPTPAPVVTPSVVESAAPAAAPAAPTAPTPVVAETPAPPKADPAEPEEM